MTQREGAAAELYYDPFDYDIDLDPYPVWKRLRDEAPLYFNARYDFFALSRFADVSDATRNVEIFRSGMARSWTI